MLKCYVTGRTGFIGGLLSKRLEQEGHKVVDNGFIDLRDHENIRNTLLSENPEIIIHLAARTEVEKSFYEAITFADINYTGTVNLIESARELKNLKLFIFASTMETYGWQPISDKAKKKELSQKEIDKNVFDENTEQNPNAPYAVAKVGCELYLKYAGRSYGLPYCILRQTNCYGRQDNDFFVIEQFITQMLQNKDVNFGYDKPYRNFIHIDDLMRLYSTIISNTGKAKNEVFCTGPNNAVQIGQLAKMIAKKTGFKGKTNWGRKRSRPGEIYYLNSTCAKAKKILGWEPKITLDEGLSKTVEFWKNELSK